MAYTTTELIAAVRREGRWGTDEPYPTAADILALADEEIDSFVLPSLLKRRAEYGVFATDYAITAAQQDYRLPDRAYGQVVRDAAILDANGRLVADLSLADGEEVDVWAGVTGSPLSLGRFAVLEDLVKLLPTPDSTAGTLRVRCYRRPGRLVATTAAAQITGVAGDVLTVAAHPFTTSSFIDIIKQHPGFATLMSNGDVTAQTATTVTVTGVPAEVAIGDWICVTRESVIPQIPAELHGILAMAVVCRIKRQMGYDSWQALRATAEHDLNEVCDRLNPRVQGARTKVFNPHSPLRGPKRPSWSRY